MSRNKREIPAGLRLVPRRYDSIISHLSMSLRAKRSNLEIQSDKSNKSNSSYMSLRGRRLELNAVLQVGQPEAISAEIRNDYLVAQALR